MTHTYSLIAHCYSAITVSGGDRRPGTRPLIPFAAFLVLAGLLLLTLSPSCLPTHHTGTAGGAHPTTSATVHLEPAGTDVSCTAFEPQSVAPRSGADGPRLGDGQAIPDAASGGQGDVAGLPDRTALTGVAVLPHGWTLLLLLAIARE
jgi:hypothetical protein